MYRKIKFKCSRLAIREIYFGGLIIVVIEIFEFPKMCIYIHDDSHINNTSFEMFHLEKVQHQPS
jgi:hypothetical protein